MTEPKPPTKDLEKRQLERLIFFSDAVFAIAITLLVLDLRLPPGSQGFDLDALGPKLFGFFLSFAVIGRYWLFHHQLFGVLVREDALLRVVNLVFLASVVFLPFPTSVIAEATATQSSVIVYALSVAAVGLLSAVLSLVARRRGLVAPHTVREPLLIVSTLVPPAIFGLSALLAMTNPRMAMKSWWLILPLLWAARAIEWAIVKYARPSKVRG